MTYLFYLLLNCIIILCFIDICIICLFVCYSIIIFILLYRSSFNIFFRFSSIYDSYSFGTTFCFCVVYLCGPACCGFICTDLDYEGHTPADNNRRHVSHHRYSVCIS